jgi:phenylacetic acid degradation operon negative regulatory protein
LKISKPTEYSFDQAANRLIEHFAKTRPIHANSLLVSIYGDTICPRGGTIWLGSLIKLVEPLGINQRLVRTSVFRLSEKNILTSKQVGRRSFYSLTERAFRQFLSASKRIYASETLAWDKQWRLVLTTLGELTNEERDLVRRELYWLGFSRITPGVYAHPMADIDEVQRAIKDLNLENRIAVLKASAANPTQVPMTNALISECFDLKRSESEYVALIRDFSGILDAAKNTQSLNPKLCFLIKTLLIHRYRHILLKEPELPDALMSTESASYIARMLVGELYTIICPLADSYFSEVSETETGSFPQPEDSYYRRFQV